MAFLSPWKSLMAVGFLIILMAGIGYSQDAIITGSVSDQFGSLPGAKVAIEGTTISTSTDVNGNFELRVKPGNYKLRASFVMYLTQTLPVNVMAGDSVHINFSLVAGFSIDQPVALGSRAQPRSLLETVVPVDIISPQEISNSSQVELSHILQYLSPSFHSTQQTISDGTDFIDPATIRGLGPDQLLVLVNGKRRHTSSLINVNGTIGRGTVGTDFNAIPVAAIDRIEILRDGAAAQYGSDAIAGVINIILKEQTGIISVDNRVGVNSEGDGLTNYAGVNYGLEVGKNGFFNLTAEYRRSESTNRAGNYTGTVFTDDVAADNAQIAATNFFDQTGFSNRQIMEIGNAATLDLTVFFNSEIQISKKATFYAHGGRNYREATAQGFYRLPKSREQVVLDLHPNGFSPGLKGDIRDGAMTFGIRGRKNNWLLDFSNTTGINELGFSVLNSNNASLGVASPSSFYAGGYVYRQNVTNFDASRSYDWLSGTNVAFGGEIRIENYEILAGEEASWINGGDTLFADGDTVARTPGAQMFPGFQPENALNKFRTNNAAYLDIETDITEKLLVEIAARYEQYTNFRGQGIGKLAGRYRLLESISLRAGFATGYRAPSLHQVYFNNVSAQFVNGEALRVGTFNNESPVAEAFGIERLKPELSNHYSAGFTTRPSDNFTFTFDYYNIKIKNRIVLSGRFGSDYANILEPLNVGAAQFFTNAIDSRTSGADAVAVYKNELGRGNLMASIAGNVTRTKVLGMVMVPDELEGEEDVLFNREEISRVENAQPNFKINSVVSYKIDKFTLELGNTYFGEVQYIHPDDGDPANWQLNELSGQVESRDQVFSPKLVTDLAIAVQLSDNMRITVGGNNILNVYPDKHTHSANINNGLFVYSRRVQQFGVQGAHYFGRILLSL